MQVLGVTQEGKLATSDPVSVSETSPNSLAGLGCFGFFFSLSLFVFKGG